MDKINHFEKIHLFDRFGKLSEPLVKTIHGMLWKISLHMGSSFDGTTPAIDVRYSCEDFGGRQGCYVIMKCNERRVGHFFQVNKSVIVFRQAYVGVRFETKKDIHVEMVQNRFKDWIFVEWKGKEEPGFNLEPYYFYDPVLFMSTSHLPMKHSSSVACKYIPSSTFATPDGEIPFEFDPSVFKDSNKEVGKWIKNMDQKTDEELRELRDVLGYFYHEHNSGMKDNGIVDTQLQTHLYGFYTSIPPSHIFSWEFRDLRVSDTPPNFETCCNSQHVCTDKFSGVAKVARNTCLLMQRDFKIGATRGSITFTMFKETVEDEIYVSFGAYFVMPPFSETYKCNIIISSSTPNMLLDVERNIKFGQNTVAIPTLFKESSFAGQSLAFQFAMKLEKLAYDYIPSYVVFPGAGDPEITLRFGTNKIRVSKKFLTNNMKMFKAWFASDYFYTMERGFINLHEDEFEGVFHVLDALYHCSKQLTVDSFTKFGCAADQYLCFKMFHLWEKCAIKSKIPEIQKFISY